MILGNWYAKRESELACDAPGGVVAMALLAEEATGQGVLRIRRQGKAYFIVTGDNAMILEAWLRMNGIEAWSGSPSWCMLPVDVTDGLSR
jgi:formamidopyrimidine-DNA glycosylase